MISTVHGVRERGGVGSSTRERRLGQGLGEGKGVWGEVTLKVGCPKVPLVVGLIT